MIRFSRGLFAFRSLGRFMVEFMSPSTIVTMIYLKDLNRAWNTYIQGKTADCPSFFSSHNIVTHLHKVHLGVVSDLMCCMQLSDHLKQKRLTGNKSSSLSALRALHRHHHHHHCSCMDKQLTEWSGKEWKIVGKLHIYTKMKISLHSVYTWGKSASARFHETTKKQHTLAPATAVCNLFEQLKNCFIHSTSFSCAYFILSVLNSRVRYVLNSLWSCYSIDLCEFLWRLGDEHHHCRPHPPADFRPHWFNADCKWKACEQSYVDKRKKHSRVTQFRDSQHTRALEV